MTNQASMPVGYSTDSCGLSMVFSFVAGPSGIAGSCTSLTVEDAIIDELLDSSLSLSWRNFSPSSSTGPFTDEEGGGVDGDMCLCRMAQILWLPKRLFMFSGQLEGIRCMFRLSDEDFDH